MLEENMLDIDTAKQNMIEQMMRPWYILNQHVINAFKAVPRDVFVPEAYKSIAYSEMRIPLTESASMLTPLLEGRFLQEIHIKKDESVLIIGTGSGFLAACAAHIGKKVVSVDINPELNKKAEEAVHKLGITNIEFKLADIKRDYINLAKSDVVIFTGSLAEVPAGIYRLLNDNGRMLAIVGKKEVMSVEIHYNYAGRIQKEAVFETTIERLVGFEDKPEFVF